MEIFVYKDTGLSQYCETPNDININDYSPLKDDYDLAVTKYDYYKATYDEMLKVEQKLASLKAGVDEANNSLTSATETTTSIFEDLYDVKTTMTDEEMKKLDQTFSDIKTLQKHIVDNTITEIETNIKTIDSSRAEIHEKLMEEATKIADGYWTVVYVGKQPVIKTNNAGEEEKYYCYNLERYRASLPSHESSD